LPALDVNSVSLQHTNNNKILADDESIQSADEVNIETLETPKIELHNKQEQSKEDKRQPKEEALLDRPAPKDTS